MKKETLEATIKCLEHLAINIGETTTEYHWREFCGLIEMLKENFPEYNLQEVQTNIYKKLIVDNNIKENNIIDEDEW
jgi:hypothetical protein